MSEKEPPLVNFRRPSPLGNLVTRINDPRVGKTLRCLVMAGFVGLVVQKCCEGLEVAEPISDIKEEIFRALDVSGDTNDNSE